MRDEMELIRGTVDGVVDVAEVLLEVVDVHRVGMATQPSGPALPAKLDHDDRTSVVGEASTDRGAKFQAVAASRDEQHGVSTAPTHPAHSNVLVDHLDFPSHATTCI
jgi:hypothetical protein